MGIMGGSDPKGQVRRIRVRLSALINFIANIYRNIFSIIFTLIVIRRLDPRDYGLYAVALNTSNALSTLNNIWIGWSSRRHVLGVRASPKASLLLGLLYLAISTPLYIYIVGPLSVTRPDGFLVMLLIIIFYMAVSPLQSISNLINLYAPEKNGLLGIMFETTRVTLSYIFIITIGSGIIGAVLGPGLASIMLIVASIAILMRIGVIGASALNIMHGLRESLREAGNILRLSVLSIPGAVTGFLISIDKYLMSLIASSTMPAAFASVASVPKSIISPGSFTIGLYAKMLSQPNKQDAVDMIVLYSFISIFMAISLSLLSIPAITFFNPFYSEGHFLLALASIEALLVGYAAIFEAIAMGSERADVVSNNIYQVVKTPLVKIPLLQMIRIAVSILVAATIQAAMYSAGVRDPVVLVLPYSVSYLVSAIPYTYYVYRLAAPKIDLEIPWRDITVFLIAMLPSALIIKILGIDGIVISSFWRDLAKLIPGIAISITPYIVISIALSKKLRYIVRAGIVFLKTSILFP